MQYLIGNSQDSIKPKWFNFSIQSSLVINKSFSNYYTNESYTLGGYHHVQNVSAKINKPVCYGYSGGLDFQIGKSKDIKQLIGLYVDFTNSYFNLDYKYDDGKYNNTHTNVDIKRQVSIAGLSYGLQFAIDKRFNFSVLACYNHILKKVETQTGYKKTSYMYVKDSTLINSKQIYINKDTAFISLRLRLGYNFKIKNQNFGVYVQRNWSLPNYHKNTYYAPWWMIGIQYYPLKNRNKYKN